MIFRIVQIQKQRKRQLMIALRGNESSELLEIDTERELETLHMTLYEHAETLKHWKNALEGTAIPEGHPPLPNNVLEQVSFTILNFSFTSLNSISRLSIWYHSLQKNEIPVGKSCNF